MCDTTTAYAHQRLDITLLAYIPDHISTDTLKLRQVTTITYMTPDPHIGYLVGVKTHPFHTYGREHSSCFLVCRQ
jgi:hypothetical protein